MPTVSPIVSSVARSSAVSPAALPVRATNLMATPDGGLLQRLDLTLDGKPAGSLVWYTSGSVDGHVQLVRVEIEPAQRRRGYGRALFRAMLEHAHQHCRSRGHRCRRITAEIPQKSHVIARAWITGLGFHHIGTVRGALTNQDLLVYMLGQD